MRPVSGLPQAQVNMYALPYQPTSSMDLNSSVILGMGVVMMVRSWKKNYVSFGLGGHGNLEGSRYWQCVAMAKDEAECAPKQRETWLGTCRP